MKPGWCMVAAAAALSFSTPLASNAQSPPIPGVPLDTPILLRLAPPEGQVSRYDYTMQAEMESPMMPTSADPFMTMRLQQTHTVLSVENQVIRFRATIDSTATTMAMAVPGMDMPDFSGSAFTAEMDTRGRVLPNVAGFNPEGIIQASSHFVFPEEEVSPGDSWTLEAPMSLQMGPAGSMSVEVATTYTFVSLEGSLATLSFEGPIDMELDAGGTGMTATGATTGTLVADLTEGRFLSQSSRTSLEVSAAGMEMTMNSTTTMELIPDP